MPARDVCVWARDCFWSLWETEQSWTPFSLKIKFKGEYLFSLLKYCMFWEKLCKDSLCVSVQPCVFLLLFRDKMFPALGFGAQLPPDWKVECCGHLSV